MGEGYRGCFFQEILVGLVKDGTIIMYTGPQKRRNFSRELGYETRGYQHRNLSGNGLFSSYSTVGLLKERSVNRSIVYLLSYPVRPSLNSLRPKRNPG